MVVTLKKLQFCFYKKISGTDRLGARVNIRLFHFPPFSISVSPYLRCFQFQSFFFEPSDLFICRKSSKKADFLFDFKIPRYLVFFFTLSYKIDGFKKLHRSTTYCYYFWLGIYLFNFCCSNDQRSTNCILHLFDAGVHIVLKRCVSKE